MTEIHRSALVVHPPERMFELVHHVESYPEFLNWCSDARVISEADGEQMASIDVSVAGISQSFSTRNRLFPNERIHMELLEGPFRELQGEWRFEALNGEASGCRISLNMRFEFASRLLGFAFGRGFTRVADHLVDDFCRRADALYGSR